MSAPPNVLTALEGRRDRLAALAEEIADEIDRMPTEELHRRLRGVARTIDTLDRLIGERREDRGLRRR